MKSEVYQERVNTREELVARIMNSASLIKKERQDDLRRAKRTIVKRVEKCIEDFIGIIYITIKCNKSFVFSSHLSKGFLCVTFKQLYLHTHLKFDTCLYKLIYSV
jgi:hypothetical protein